MMFTVNKLLHNKKYYTNFLDHKRAILGSSSNSSLKCLTMSNIFWHSSKTCPKSADRSPGRAIPKYQYCFLENKTIFIPILGLQRRAVRHEPVGHNKKISGPEN